MPGATDTVGGGYLTPGVLRPLGKENVNTSSDRRLKSSSPGFPVFKDEAYGICSTNEKLRSSSPELLNALKHAEAESARYKEELHHTRASLQARHERVQELKAAAASINQRHTTLLKSHEEATKELGLLRAMAENSELLREERSSLEAKLAKREAVLFSVKKEVIAAIERESNIRGELERVKGELKIGSQGASGGTKAGGEIIPWELQSRWSLEKAALDAQIKELEEQLTTSQRRCSVVVAERAVLAEEATRREKEHSAKVAALQEELHSLQRRTSADLGDWQRRHREALVAKKAVERQLERLVEASKSIARVAEKQAVLEASFQEASELLSQAVFAESSLAATGRGPESAERVAEGVIENLLGRVFEATSIRQAAAEVGVEGNERGEHDVELLLREEETVLLGGKLEKLTANMGRLRAFGVAEAEVYLDQARSLETELKAVREGYVAALSELEASQSEYQQEVEHLTQRLSEGDRERNTMKVQLESAAQELATTVQLSEMALAAKDSTGEEGGRSEGESRRKAVEAEQRMEELEAQIDATREKLESEREACTKKCNALQEDNSKLQEKLKENSSQASALMDKTAVRSTRERDERPFPPSGVSIEDDQARERKLKELEARLLAVVTENEELGKRMENAALRGDHPSLQLSFQGRGRIMELEAEVSQLREQVSAEQERVKKSEEDDRRMRKYVLHYSTRCEHKMKEMQKRLAIATARAVDEL